MIGKGAKLCRKAWSGDHVRDQKGKHAKVMVAAIFSGLDALI
jgi:hypothetical protein